MQALYILLCLLLNMLFPSLTHAYSEDSYHEYAPPETEYVNPTEQTAPQTEHNSISQNLLSQLDSLIQESQLKWKSLEDRYQNLNSEIENLQTEDYDNKNQATHNQNTENDSTPYNTYSKPWRILQKLDSQNLDDISLSPVFQKILTQKNKHKKSGLSQIQNETLKNFENTLNTYYLDRETESEKISVLRSQLFIGSSELRSKTIANLINSKEATLLGISQSYPQDLILEFFSIPFRWISLFKSRFQSYKAEFQKGFKGILFISFDILIFIFIIYLGFLFFRKFSHISTWLNNKRASYQRKAYRDPKSRKKALWINRLSPHIPWVSFGVYFYIVQELIKQSHAKELSLLFPYLIFYACYRIVRILVNQILSGQLFRRNLQNVDAKKIKWTAHFISGFFFLTTLLLYTLQTAAGKGLLYFWASKLLSFMFIVTLLWMGFRWRQELKQSLLSIFPPNTHPIINRLLSGFLAWIFCFPALGIVSFHFLFSKCFGWLEQFEWFKKISAEIFRKKIEGLQKEDPTQTPKNQALPKEYTKLFTNSDSLEKPYDKFSQQQKEIFSSIKDHVKSWSNSNSDDHVIALKGERGIGKTHLLKKLLSTENENLDCIYHSIRTRIDTVEDLEQELTSHDILSLAESSKKKIILLDNAENLFLSKVGGFNVLQSMIQKIEESGNQFFWVLSFHNNSWEFLQSVYKNTEHFHHVYNLKHWSEEELKSYILHSHQLSEYTLSFDHSLYPSGHKKNPETNLFVENKYFRILWEESNGNPKVAIPVWLSSLKYKGSKKVAAGLPRDRVEIIQGLPDDFYFVLSNIERHKILTMEEILISTDLNKDLIRNALKVCTEKNYLEKKGAYYSVSPLWQHSVTSTLKRKNFIYG